MCGIVGTDAFFEKLLDVKRRKYAGGRFQLQFSIHTTDETLRGEIVPVKKWGFTRIADYAEGFIEDGDKKIALNFAIAEGMPVDVGVLIKHFNPQRFVIKITPINPTHRAVDNQLISYVNAYDGQRDYDVIDDLRSAGYEVIARESDPSEFITNMCSYSLHFPENAICSPLGDQDDRQQLQASVKR